MDRNYRRRTSVSLLYLSLDYDTADDRVDAAVILDGPVGLACHQLRCNLIAANRDNRDGVFCRAVESVDEGCVGGARALRLSLGDSLVGGAGQLPERLPGALLTGTSTTVCVLTG
jgi:hypothetical protein